MSGEEEKKGKDGRRDVNAAARQRQETHHRRRGRDGRTDGGVEQKRKVSGENCVHEIIGDGEFRGGCESTPN